MNEPTPETRQPEPVTFNCHTCADRGEVGLILESFAGPVRKAIPCPECGGDPLKFTSARDAAIHRLDDRIGTLAKAVAVIGICVILVTILSATKPAQFIKANVTDIGEGVTS